MFYQLTSVPSFYIMLSPWFIRASGADCDAAEQKTDADGQKRARDNNSQQYVLAAMICG